MKKNINSFKDEASGKLETVSVAETSATSIVAPHFRVMNRHWLLLSFLALITVAASPFPYAPPPQDPYFVEQWHLENVTPEGVRRGVDVNVRAAWEVTRGEGIVIGIADNGVELSHPDLAGNAAAGLHWNFDANTPDGNHATDRQNHGTPVAGLAAAVGGNNVGASGVAPAAQFASWVIFRTNLSGNTFVETNQLAAMFEFQNEQVQVQNHSWARLTDALVPLSSIEDAAISNAVVHGRDGKGVVMVRAVGNSRVGGRNANDDAYMNDPRVITVAGIRADGRVASVSNPGANILVGAPAGDTANGYPNLFTTDRVGGKGLNQISFTNDLADYVFAGLGFSGTSGSAPIVSGVAALILSANPELTYRDVQQILINSSHQTHPDDQDLVTNGAGYVVSHNTGFGLVDAGWATQLATTWSNRPPLTVATESVSSEQAIPDAGLRVLIRLPGGEVPLELSTLVALPSLGRFADEPTEILDLVDVGQASQPLDIDLTGKGALLQRGGGAFNVKLENVANAGAEFALVFNNQGDTSLEVMGATDFIAIPAVFLSQRDGEALRGFLAANPATTAQIALARISYEIPFEESLLTEHVALTVHGNHSARGELRITLISPQGTRSVLQRLGPDLSPFTEWTYTSTHHFYENSAGVWKVEISDQAFGETGSIQSLDLTVYGVPIVDSDRDGLEDEWEQAQFGTLSSGPIEDSDQDGYINSREQILGTPAAGDRPPLETNIAQWSHDILRLNWTAKEGKTYEVFGASDLDGPLSLLTNVPGRLPEAEWFVDGGADFQFFQVQEK